jgi:peptidoglycan/xylan/chitin deacetylase (PgdA/CDA1 family)
MDAGRIQLIRLSQVAMAATFAFAGMQPVPASAQEGATAPDSAVVMMYHRFGESGLPATNIRIEQFEAHLKELTEGDYRVRPLGEIVTTLKSGQPLPGRNVALTIDDAFLSVYTEAWPRLKKKGLPFTLFVATDSIDRNLAGYMSWDQIRELKEAGVTLGSQTAAHPHMPSLSKDKIRAELSVSNARFKVELGEAPKLFAYPYGEASLAVIEAVKDAGFDAAFGQHSGVLYKGSRMLYLPRFAMNESYGDAKRFILAANAMPLYATEVTPKDPTLGPNPPAFGFTVGANIKGLKSLACYSSAHGKLAIERLGPRRIEVRPPRPFPPGRARVNCTMPDEGRWRWFGMQFFVPARQSGNR